jgi:two-component system sensor kinase
MDARLLAETEAAAYRIVQEALNNVAKHARATECRVHLSRTPDTLHITIEDNGAGFDPTAARSVDRRGLGLVGIRERASHLKGAVVVESAPGEGTRLLVDLPVRRATDNGEPLYTPDSAALAGLKHV